MRTRLAMLALCALPCLADGGHAESAVFARDTAVPEPSLIAAAVLPPDNNTRMQVRVWAWNDNRMALIQAGALQMGTNHLACESELTSAGSSHPVMDSGVLHG